MLVDNIVDRKGVSVISNHATHPGILLKDEIEYRQLGKSHTANQLGLKPGHLSEIFKGKRHISPSLAIKLQEVLEIPAENWLLLQMKYDLAVARKLFNDSKISMRKAKRKVSSKRPQSVSA